MFSSSRHLLCLFGAAMVLIPACKYSGSSELLGAFLAGASLSETRYRYQVEADVAPFRGMLLGIFGGGRAGSARRHR